jgi:GTP cyclohydrolase II
VSNQAEWMKATETPFRSCFGRFVLRAYEFASGREHAAVVVGDPTTTAAPLVRLQSSCLTGTALGAVVCDCRAQLEESLRRVQSVGCGAVLYLDQEGRGYGLVEKVRQLSLVAAGVANTLTAVEPDTEPDLRRYTEAAAILRDVTNARTLRLLTNNPKKITALHELGFAIERVALEATPTPENVEYLRTKKQLMGHLLNSV